MNGVFSFTGSQLSELFPLHLVIDHNLILQDVSPALAAIYPCTTNRPLSDFFLPPAPSFEALIALQHQSLTLQAIHPHHLLFNGRFFYTPEQQQLFFAASQPHPDPSQHLLYEHILNNITAEIVVLSPDRRYLFVNPEAIPNPEIRQWLIGKTDLDYCQLINKPTELADIRNAAFDKAINTRSAQSWEEESVNSTGQKHYKVRNLLPVHDDIGHLRFVIGFSVDITNLKNIQTELVFAKQRTEEIANAKQRFLANMSHEIRTPMTGIIGVADILQKSLVEHEQRRLVHIIQESAKNLLVIANDILDLEKIASGKIALEHIPFNLVNKVSLAIESFRYKAIEKNIHLSYSNHLPSNLTVIGDPFRLTQVLNNLVSNALKFTPKGTIHLYTALKWQKGDAIVVEFGVKDTGIGIQQDRIAEMFEPFTQGGANVARQYGGTGLGLSICRDLVHKMGGSIDLDDSYTQGTHFLFTIPYSLGHAPPESIAPTLIDKSIVQRLNILVAEDMEINQFLIKYILRSWGCAYTLVNTGKKALEHLQKENYDLILMDIQMPEMSGTEATQLIRQMPDTNKATIPIIALTANALKGDAEFFKAAGMTDYLSKPFDEMRLYDAILKVLKSKDNTLANQQLDNIAPDGQTQYDLSQLKTISKGDYSFISQMVHLFLTTMPPLMTELQESTSNADWEAVRKVAHKMKPAIDSMGIHLLRDVIRSIETNVKESVDETIIREQVNTVDKILNTCIIQLNNDFPSNGTV